MARETVASRLARLRRVPIRRAASDGASSSANEATDAGDLEARGLSLGGPRALDVVAAERGSYAVRIDRIGADFRHGGWLLDEVDAVHASTLASLARDAALGELDLRRAVYLDIETTGLSGGAGTIAFLVGLGSFTPGGFELWQGFLRGPEEEAAMLAEVAARIAQGSALVSFFGKSFDRHRLEDKMRYHGITPPFAGRPHLDLYHPLARVYRDGFADGRLATMERELCAVERTDDLPGRFAPEAWFDFLAARPHRLEAVFRHNHVDVLSLVVLAAHLGRVLHECRHDDRPLAGPAGVRARGLARLFAAERRRSEALTWAERALERLPGDDRPLRALRADLLRYLHQDQAALQAYEALANEATDELAVHAMLQTAKISEHRLRDKQRARASLARARRLFARATPGRLARGLLVELERRELRLGRA